MGAGRSLTGLDDLEREAFDGCVDASGEVAVISRSVDFVRPGGKILPFGVPPAG